MESFEVFSGNYWPSDLLPITSKWIFLARLKSWLSRNMRRAHGCAAVDRSAGHGRFLGEDRLGRNNRCWFPGPKAFLQNVDFFKSHERSLANACFIGIKSFCSFDIKNRSSIL